MGERQNEWREMEMRHRLEEMHARSYALVLLCLDALWLAGGQADPFGTAAVFDDDEEPAMVSVGLEA